MVGLLDGANLDSSYPLPFSIPDCSVSSSWPLKPHPNNKILNSEAPAIHFVTYDPPRGDYLHTLGCAPKFLEDSSTLVQSLFFFS